MSEASYVGKELDIFAHARNWKRYWASHINLYLEGEVLEVGAGIGTNTATLLTPKTRSWTCLEPDPQLAARLSESTPPGSPVQVIVGTLSSMHPAAKFDAVVYIDVLEHIENDKQELAQASIMLRPAGRLIVLAPAHQFLYSPFDEAIGHYRRYNRASLLACQPPSVKLERILYLDSAGLIASFLNKLLLRQTIPTLAQIKTWDRLLVPISRLLDPLLFHRLGKSLLAVWTKT